MRISTGCDHRVSNKEIDFVIERIMNKSYLFAPPRGMRNGRQTLMRESLYDVAKQTTISSSAHSQSPQRIYVRCQRCGRGSQYVYLYRVYKRMVDRGLIEAYPEVEEVYHGKFLPKYYLILK